MHAKGTEETFRGHYYASVKNVIPIKNRRFLLRICSGALISLFILPPFFHFILSFFFLLFSLGRDRRQSFPFYSRAFYFEHFYPPDSACKVGRRYLKIQSSSHTVFRRLYARIIYICFVLVKNLFCIDFEVDVRGNRFTELTRTTGNSFCQDSVDDCSIFPGQIFSLIFPTESHILN